MNFNNLINEATVQLQELGGGCPFPSVTRSVYPQGKRHPRNHKTI